MPLTQNSANAGARWSVMWMHPRTRHITEKKFGEDFGAALEAFTTLKQHGRKLVTLRSCNVGFPPPKHITHHPEEYYEVVTKRRRGKRVRVRVKHTRHVDLLETKYNPQGIWWCPYCAKLRPFKEWTEWTGREHMRCPVCKITERDFHVRRWNPQAKTMEYRRRTRGRRRRRWV